MLDDLDEERFTREIVNLLKNKEKREKFGEMGKEYVKKNFSIQSSVKQICSLYEEVIDSYK